MNEDQAAAIIKVLDEIAYHLDALNGHIGEGTRALIAVMFRALPEEQQREAWEDIADYMGRGK